MTEAVADAPVPDLVPTSDPAPEPVEIETTEAPEVPTDETDQSTATGEADDAEGIEDREAALEKEFKAAYTRKTQELAEVRKGVEARVQKLDAIVTQAEALAGTLAAEFQAEFQHVNWGELAANDPAKYVQERHKYDERQRKLALAVGQLQAAKQQQAMTQQEAIQQRLAEEQQKLLDAMPEWKDQKKFAAEAADLREYLTKSGYDPDEVNGVTDHRAVMLARKAMLYDRMVAKAPKPAAVPKAPPPIQKATTKTSGPKDWTQMTDKEFAEWRRRSVAQRR